MVAPQSAWAFWLSPDPNRVGKKSGKGEDRDPLTFTSLSFLPFSLLLPIIPPVWKGGHITYTSTRTKGHYLRQIRVSWAKAGSSLLWTGKSPFQLNSLADRCWSHCMVSVCMWKTIRLPPTVPLQLDALGRTGLRACTCKGRGLRHNNPCSECYPHFIS